MRAIATMTKLGGMLNMAERPVCETEATLMAVEMNIAIKGRAVSLMAVAAGVTRRQKEQGSDDLTRHRHREPEQRHKDDRNGCTGTYLACATSGLTDAKNKGDKSSRRRARAVSESLQT